MTAKIGHVSNVSDCDPTNSARCYVEETISWTANSACATWNTSFNPPASYSISGCVGPISLPPNNQPNGNVKAI